MTMKVVILDDDAFLLVNVKDAFRINAPDCEVTTLRMPHAYPENLPEEADIFFVDNRMGELKGPEVIRQLRVKYPEAQIVMWSSQLDEKTRREGLEAGADRVEDKRMSSSQIVELATKLLWT